MVPFLEVTQGLFIYGEICLIKIQRSKGGVIGQQPVCDDGAVAELAQNWRN